MEPTTDTLDAPSSHTATASTDTTSIADDAPKLVEEELLVEEISIDGMCGVY